MLINIDNFVLTVPLQMDKNNGFLIFKCNTFGPIDI